MRVELHPDGRSATLLEPITWGDITVPAGFVTDFASVPRALWILIPPQGRHSFAAVVHDWLYQSQQLTRREADRLFRLSLRATGSGNCKAWAMYLGVRLGGWVAWRHHARVLTQRADQIRPE
jgi:hypothetical protein